MGRLLVGLLLVEWGLLAVPLLDLSAFLEPRRDEYYARLLAVCPDGDWSGWVSFFLEAVRVQADDVVRRAHNVQRLRDNYRDRVATARSSGLLARLADALFETPALTINRARAVLGVTHSTAALTVAKLVETGILVEVPTPRRHWSPTGWTPR